MAIINCPECGQQISSNAEHCIHCGCVFTYCPECQTVSLGKINQCPSCGFMIKNEAVTAGGKAALEVVEEVEPLSETQQDIFKIWQDSCAKDKKMLSVLKGIKIVLGVISIVFIAIGFLILYKWVDGDHSGISDLKLKIKILIGFACIFEIIDFVYDYFRDSIIKIHYSKWLRAQNFDSISYIKEQISIHGYDYFTLKQANGFDVFKESSYLAANPSRTSAFYVGMVVRLIIATAFTVCGGICMMQNVEEWIRTTIASSNTEFVFQYVALIPFGIFLIAYGVAALIMDGKYSKMYKAWINEKIPELNED